MTDLRPLLIDLLLTGAALVVFLVDLVLPHGRKRMLGGLTGGMLAVLLGLTFVVDRFKGWAHSGHITLQRGERSRLADFASEAL